MRRSGWSRECIDKSYIYLYTFVVEFDWDETKNRANVEKHGVDFRDVKDVFRDVRVTAIDDRREYGENRKVTIGQIGDRVLVVVYAEREGVVRIISARRANRRERSRYYERLRRENTQNGRKSDGPTD